MLMQTAGELPIIDLVVEDFQSVAELYSAICRELVHLEESRAIKCDTEILVNLMRQIDYVYEMCLTDNQATDLLFKNSSLPQ